MRYILVLIFFLRLNAVEDFEVAYGKGSPIWKHVMTPEDKQNVLFFKGLYEKNLSPITVGHIPKVIHWIWLGPDSFPEKSKKRIQAMMKLNPGWKFKFWTDIDREVPCSGMEKTFVKKFQFQRCKNCYDRSDNFWEKSIILSYEILYQEGGLVIDHDIEPRISAENLLSSYDFFCSLEPLRTTVLSTSVYPSTCMIASKPKHPVIDYTLSWLDRNWDQMGVEFIGDDLTSMLNRVMHRSVSAFGYGVRRGIDLPGNRDMVFPKIPFGSHASEHTWAKSELVWGGKAGQEISSLQKKVNILEILGLSAVAVNCLLLCLVWEGRRQCS